MPPPRIQSDPTRGQPEDGDHGVSLCPGPPPPASLSPSAPPTQLASKRTQMRTSGFYTKYLYQILLYCTERGMRPHLLPFLLPPPTSHLYKMLGKVKNPPLHALLPTTNLLLFLFETCSSVSLFIRGVLEGQKQNKRLGRQAWKSYGNQPWKWGGNVKGYSRCVNPNFLNPSQQICTKIVGNDL